MKLPFDKETTAFLEETVQHLADFSPTQLAVVAMNEEGLTLSGYHNSSATDLRTMAFALLDDAMWKVLQANADALQRILDGEEDEAEESDAGTEE